MKTSDMPRFAKIMSEIGELYEKEITEGLSERYWKTWERFEIQRVDEAVNKYIAHPSKGHRMPKPSDIVLMIEGTYEMRALLAWAAVVETMRRVGAYSSVAFEDLSINTAIDAMGGWVKLCMTRDNDMPFVAQDFQKYYILFLQHPPQKPSTYAAGLFSTEEIIKIESKYQIYPMLEYQDESAPHLLTENKVQKIEHFR